MSQEIHHNLEAITDVALYKAKEHKCNYNVIISNAVDGKYDREKGSTYEFVSDSYFAKERPRCVIVAKTDFLIMLENLREYVYDYWTSEMVKDRHIYGDTDGLDVTAMGESAAEHFVVSTDEGNTDIETKLFDLAVDFEKDFIAGKIRLVGKSAIDVDAKIMAADPSEPEKLSKVPLRKTKGGDFVPNSNNSKAFTRSGFTSSVLNNFRRNRK